MTQVIVSITVLGEAGAGYTDSDIWGHVAIGLDTLRAGHLLRVDPYSFTHDQPWINHEWLWDVCVAWLFNAGGLPALVALRVALVAVVIWAASRASRGAPGWARTVAMCVVAVSCIGQWRSTRPQLATLALYGVLLSNLTSWWLPLLFALWANVHGGWVFGLAALVTNALMNHSRKTLVIATLCTLATLLNPYGIHLWLAIAAAVHRGWADVTEWQPVWRIGAGIDAALVWMLLVGTTASLWRRVRSGARWPWLWSAFALLAAANSRRLTSLAALTVGIALMPKWLAQEPEPPLIWTPGQRWMSGAAIAIAVTVALLTIRPTLTCFPPLAQWAGPESGAVAFLENSNARRIVPHFDYGEYAIFHLRGQAQVAIDNRRETVYSNDVVEANQRFMDGLDPEYPDRIGADAVWWPTRDVRVIDQLLSRGWIRRFDGPRTVVLMKTVGPTVKGVETIGTPCFPRP